MSRMSDEKKKEQKKNNIKGCIVLLGAAVIWGFAFAAQRDGMDHMGPFFFGAIRMYMGAAVLLPFIIIRRMSGKVKTSGSAKDQKHSLLFGGIVAGTALCVATNLQQVALITEEAGKAGFITAMYIVLVPMVRAFVFHKKIKPGSWIAVATGAVALYLISGMYRTGFSMSTGTLLLIGCAFMFTVQILVLDKTAKQCDPLEITCIEFLVTATLTLVPAFMTEQLTVNAFSGALVPLLYTGLLSSGVAYTLQTIGERLAEPEPAAIAMSMESVFSLIGGFIILHETISGPELAGCALMFAAMLLAG